MTSIRQSGYSLLELQVALAILLVVVTLAFNPLGSFRDATMLSAAEEQIRVMLYDARSKTLAGRNASSFGVAFMTNQAVLFEGSSYAPENVIETYSYPSRGYLSEASLYGGESYLVYERLTGEVSAHGYIVLRILSSPDRATTITIGEGGVVE